MLSLALMLASWSTAVAFKGWFPDKQLGMPVIPVLRKLRERGWESKTSLGDISRWLRNNNKGERKGAFLVFTSILSIVIITSEGNSYSVQYWNDRKYRQTDTHTDTSTNTPLTHTHRDRERERESKVILSSYRTNIFNDKNKLKQLMSIKSSLQII